jgi:hypothetical protein
MKKEPQAEIVRRKISKFLDDKKNLNDASVKSQMFEELHKENPNFKKPSIHASISKYLKPEQEKRGIVTLGSNIKAKFDDSLNIKTKDGKTGIKNQNPLIEKNDNAKSELETKSELKNYSSAICESTGNLMYSAFSITDEDMEGLTEQERKDVGEMLKPLMDRYASGERGEVLISLTLIFAVFVNKKRVARQKRKTREAKLKSPNNETQKEFPPTSQHEPTSKD